MFESIVFSNWGNAIPMKLTDDQGKFFKKKREPLNQIWSWLGYAILAAFAVFAVFFFFRYPLLANPFHTFAEIQANNIDDGTLVMLAGLCPIMILALGFHIFFFLIICQNCQIQERKLLKIIKTLNS